MVPHLTCQSYLLCWSAVEQVVARQHDNVLTYSGLVHRHFTSNVVHDVATAVELLKQVCCSEVSCGPWKLSWAEHTAQTGTSVRFWRFSSSWPSPGKCQAVAASSNEAIRTARSVCLIVVSKVSIVQWKGSFSEPLKPDGESPLSRVRQMGQDCHGCCVFLCCEQYKATIVAHARLSLDNKSERSLGQPKRHSRGRKQYHCSKLLVKHVECMPRMHKYDIRSKKNTTEHEYGYTKVRYRVLVCHRFGLGRFPRILLTKQE